MSKKDFAAERAINLKGKAYLQVADRIVAFRKDYPTFTIANEVLRNKEEQPALVRCSIADDKGRVLCVAHKAVVKRGGAAAQYPVESAETGAVGRALGMLGYGTKMGDLDEGDQLADSPVDVKSITGA